MILIEYQMLGVAMFRPDLPDAEKMAGEVARIINMSVKPDGPHFDWRADQAVIDSKIKVMNRSNALFERCEAFGCLYQANLTEAAQSVSWNGDQRPFHCRCEYLQLQVCEKTAPLVSRTQ